MPEMSKLSKRTALSGTRRDLAQSVYYWAWGSHRILLEWLGIGRGLKDPQAPRPLPQSGSPACAFSWR